MSPLNGRVPSIAGISKVKTQFLPHLEEVAPSGNHTQCSKSMMKKWQS